MNIRTTNAVMQMMMTERTAEHVSQGHPDKFCDQCADAIFDRMLEASDAIAGDDVTSPDHARHQRSAIEILAKDYLVVVSGEIKNSPAVASRIDVSRIVKDAWTGAGFPDAPKVTVINHLQTQSSDIAQGVDAHADGVSEGAGDQGIMVGYATDETASMMPADWDMAQRLCRKIQELRSTSTLKWLGADTKTQATLSAANEPIRIVIAAQHADGLSMEEIREALMVHAVRPIVGDIDPAAVVINGTGRFVEGGTIGDAGVVGRKIVVDAYGPSVPVGGGAYSGKDPTKVDRSAAYMARHVAKTIVANKVGDASTCLVKIAYGIGQKEPTMVTAITGSGLNLSGWVRKNFDLSPRAIINYLGLLRGGAAGRSWAYRDAAAFGHYGRDMFPWERIADIG